MDEAKLVHIRQRIRAGGRRNRKTAVFLAQLLLNRKEIDIVDGEEWSDNVAELLSAIGMPQSYSPMVKSILWAVEELEREGYHLQANFMDGT